MKLKKTGYIYYIIIILRVIHHYSYILSSPLVIAFLCGMVLVCCRSVYTMSSAHLCLKARHSLIGMGLVPVILELQTLEDTLGILARLKREHPLEKYSSDELGSEFKGLSGENLSDVLTLAGRDSAVENCRLAMHFTILHANAVGAPKGVTLSQMGSPRNEAGSSRAEVGSSRTTSAPSQVETGSSQAATGSSQAETELPSRSEAGRQSGNTVFEFVASLQYHF